MDDEHDEQAMMMRALRAAVAQLGKDNAKSALLLIDWGDSVSLLAGVTPGCTDEQLRDMVQAAPRMVHDWARKAEDRLDREDEFTVLWN